VTEQQLLRMAKRRLAILRHAEEITGNVSLTCRYYGISRQCFYTWKRRYDAHGLDGLRDRSHRPQVSPNATRTEVVGIPARVIDEVMGHEATGRAGQQRGSAMGAHYRHTPRDGRPYHRSDRAAPHGDARGR
jgi:hypothetical protein